jgi:hypothetical protein
MNLMDVNRLPHTPQESDKTPSSPSLGESIAARIHGILDPDQIERIREGLLKALAYRHPHTPLVQNQAAPDPELHQYSHSERESSPRAQTTDAPLNPEIDDSQD